MQFATVSATELMKYPLIESAIMGVITVSDVSFSDNWFPTKNDHMLYMNGGRKEVARNHIDEFEDYERHYGHPFLRRRLQHWPVAMLNSIRAATRTMSFMRLLVINP